ncbi:MAG: hypothetical protein KDA31_03145 [Phycisphaerales bacterium]|nr:hypothetical protein [Phycisphaerales bacterium]MCB9837202.1 hypothetical protein [Phycisphaera sp.]
MKAMIACLGAAAALLLAGCTGKSTKVADLATIYNEAAQHIGSDRTPVVVIPGILGSKLVDGDGTKVWGSFTFGAADPDFPVGARRVALPMRQGVPLSQLRDEVYAQDVLDTVTVDVGLLRGFEIGAYIDIMKTLAAGKYRDQSLGRSGAVDYGGLHYTCFQLPYDWRRDISEQAAALEGVIAEAQQLTRDELGLSENEPVKVDVVAHSMGGLVLRYYLRYGTQPLPDDGSMPELTWAGAKNVRQAVLIGTPNAGSVLALKQLVEGYNLNPIFPNYRPSILGTMPAIYQLLPRTRHARVVDAGTREPIDLYDIGVWERFGWGLVSPDEDDKLRELLPEIESREDRLAIARDQLVKSLARAKQLHEALDIKSQPPEGTTISIFVGDSEDTPAVIGVRPNGSLRVLEFTPGDRTVTRDSAVMDERVGSEWKPFLQSPIAWRRVQFIFEDHLGLTRNPAFVDNLLFMLLESSPSGVGPTDD